MPTLTKLLPLILLLFVACSTGSDDPDSTDAPTQPAVQSTPSPLPAVTWHQDIKPLVSRSCLRCHTDEGVGPGDFSTYDAVAPLAPIMAALVDAGLMPPGAADPTCHDYYGSERMTLTDEEKALFSTWVDLGVPEGISDSAEALPYYEDKIPDEDMDLILFPKVGHTPKFDATGNDYHCMVLETGMTETFYINALDIRLDKSKMVHHVLLYVDYDGDLGEEGKNEAGFQCFHGQNDWGTLTTWAPGAGAVRLPEGTGLKIEPHQKIIIQTHYYDSFEGAALTEDRSGFALKVTPEVEEEMYMLGYGPTSFEIPIGDPAYTATEAYTMNGEIPALTIWASFPHMHVLGEAYRYWIEDRNGQETCILDSDDYDFHNQLIYSFKEPVQLNQGDSIYFSCTWDNSAENPNQINSPPQEITYGEGTNDEMCWAFSYVTVGR